MNGRREAILDSAGLRIRFHFSQDRWAHQVLLAQGATWHTVLESLEGSPLEDWPASPPLQSLNRDERDGVQLALLVGMAGKSHWSASVALDSAGRVTFDVACRVRGGAPGTLGSGYRRAHAEVSGPNKLLVGQPASLVMALDESIGPARFELDDDRIAIRALDQPRGAASTVRWGYTIEPITR